MPETGKKKRGETFSFFTPYKALFFQDFLPFGVGCPVFENRGDVPQKLLLLLIVAHGSV